MKEGNRRERRKPRGEDPERLLAKKVILGKAKLHRYRLLVFPQGPPRLEINERLMMNLTQAEQRWLDAFRRELTKQFGELVEQVLIYGSKARGDATPESDLDVLLIVRDEAADRKREMRDIGYLLAADGAVVPSIMAYTVQEWESRRKSGSPFRKAVEKDKVRVL